MPTECGPATSPAPRHQHPQELLMSLRKTALVAATAALSLASVGTASATTLNTDPGNVPFATGTVTFKNTSSGTATLTTALGNITCTTAHVQASANNNHAATLTGTLNQLTLTSCTDTIPLLTFSSCHLHGPTPGIRITSTDTTSGSVSIFDMTIRCGVTSGAACYVTGASANGVADNVDSTISYTGVSVIRVTGTPVRSEERRVGK